MNELRAVIGVRYSNASTWYVRRSQSMKNYPGVWSLPSIQFGEGDLAAPQDLRTAKSLLQGLADQRLGGVPVRVKEYLLSGQSARTPLGDILVRLHLYAVEFEREPILNRALYTDSRWMTPSEYQEASRGERCGLCLRLWSDYAYLMGLSDRPFLPAEAGPTIA